MIRLEFESLDENIKNNSNNMKNKIVKKSVKMLTISSFMLISACLGDNYNIMDRYFNPIFYYGVETEDYFSNDPFALEKKIIINEDGKLETYFGMRDGELYRVRENNHTATTLDNIIDSTHQKISNAKDYLNDNLLYWSIRETIYFGIKSIFF